MDINEFLEILERKGFNIDYETLFEQNLGGEIDFADILKRIDKYEVARIQTEKSRLNLKAVENEKEIDDERIAAFNMKEAEILREFKTVIDVIEKETVLAVSVDYENSRKEIERYFQGVAEDIQNTFSMFGLKSNTIIPKNSIVEKQEKVETNIENQQKQLEEIIKENQKNIEEKAEESKEELENKQKQEKERLEKQLEELNKALKQYEENNI